MLQFIYCCSDKQIKYTLKMKSSPVSKDEGELLHGVRIIWRRYPQSQTLQYALIRQCPSI